MVNEAAIQEAIIDLKSQKVTNYADTAKRFGIAPKTLERRFKGQNVSTAEFHSQTQQLLTNAQEEVLVEWIWELLDCSLPPTLQILENLVVEIVKQPVGSRWVERFQKCYKMSLQVCIFAISI